MPRWCYKKKKDGATKKILKGGIPKIYSKPNFLCCQLF